MRGATQTALAPEALPCRNLHSRKAAARRSSIWSSKDGRAPSTTERLSAKGPLRRERRGRSLSPPMSRNGWLPCARLTFSILRRKLPTTKSPNWRHRFAAARRFYQLYRRRSPVA